MTNPAATAIAARNAREEADERVGARFEARVLEPSPPAVAEEPWFADDPTDPSDAPSASIGPTAAAALTWDRWLAEQPDHRTWAAERWLGAYRPLAPPPRGLATTRLALHRLAIYVMSPARRRANGKIALRWTLGGFGTPFYGDDEQVRVEGDRLVRQVGGSATSVPITSLAAAARFALEAEPDLAWADEFDVPPAGDLDEPLNVDGAAARWLGEFFGFATSVLEELRAEPASTDTSRVQLWVEHFDCAFECLPEDEGRRAGFGTSPGDGAIPEPYLYVVPWNGDRIEAGALWNASAFRGVLPLSAIADAPDQRAAALSFLRERRDALARA